MGGKSQKMKVAEYRLSTHFGICLSGVRLRKLWFGEKIAWEGDVTDAQVLQISKPDLFGGVQKEGGVAGNVYWLPGNDTQTMPEELASKLGLTTATCPGFRGFASIFCVGDGTPVGATPSVRYGGVYIKGSAGSTMPGFVWGNNNPYIKTAWVTVTGEPQFTAGSLPAETAMIGDDANPVHIIFDCLVDPNLMGAPVASLNVPRFAAAAQTIFDEAFGLSMGWFNQSTPETFISEVLDHIQATVFVNPADGLFDIKLLRDDYDPDDLPTFDESNSKLTDFQRKSWGETVNEINVAYTNPENEDSINVTAQDLGNIIAQNSVVSDSRDYYGVRNPDLAMFLATRDVRTAAAPLASCTLEIFRTTDERIIPGGVIKVTNAKRGLNGVIFRITEIDYGRTTDSKIRLSLIEDIFGFRVGAYFTPPSSMHTGGEQPAPAAYTKTLTMPAFLLAQYAGAFPDEDETFAGLLATTTGSDTSKYELWSEQTSLGGSVAYALLGDRMLNGRTVLTDDLAQEATSLMTFSGVTLGVSPENEGFILIGGLDTVQEIGFLREIDSNDEWIVDRGMLDTTPKAWPAGTEVWFISTEVPFGDSTALADGQTVNYKILPKTSLGTLALEDADVIPVTVSDRPQLPIRPAAVRVNGFDFGEIDLISVAESDGDITVTWALRNRDMEETRVYAWNEPGLTPPDGVTTTIRIYTGSGDLISEHEGITGESYVLDPYHYAGKTLIRVLVIAVDADGNESLQGHELTIRVGYGGFGLNFGYTFGGGA